MPLFCIQRKYTVTQTVTVEAPSLEAAQGFWDNEEDHEIFSDDRGTLHTGYGDSDVRVFAETFPDSRDVPVATVDENGNGVEE